MKNKIFKTETKKIPDAKLKNRGCVWFPPGILYHSIWDGELSNLTPGDLNPAAAHNGKQTGRGPLARRKFSKSFRSAGTLALRPRRGWVRGQDEVQNRPTRPPGRLQGQPAPRRRCARLAGGFQSPRSSASAVWQYLGGCRTVQAAVPKRIRLER